MRKRGSSAKHKRLQENGDAEDERAPFNVCPQLHSVMRDTIERFFAGLSVSQESTSSFVYLLNDRLLCCSHAGHVGGSGSGGRRGARAGYSVRSRAGAVAVHHALPGGGGFAGSEQQCAQRAIPASAQVAFQLSATEYELFYSGMAPMDYVRYVSCDLTSVPVNDNPSPVRSLVKRFSEVSCFARSVDRTGEQALCARAAGELVGDAHDRQPADAR